MHFRTNFKNNPFLEKNKNIPQFVYWGGKDLLEKTNLQTDPLPCNLENSISVIKPPHRARPTHSEVIF
jgi:hypothetical protein